MVYIRAINPGIRHPIMDGSMRAAIDMLSVSDRIGVPTLLGDHCGYLGSSALLSDGSSMPQSYLKTHDAP